MEKQQQAVLDRLARIPSFLDGHTIELGTASRSPARVELDALVRVITAQGRAQVAATGQVRLCTLRLNALRHEVVQQHLRPIAAIAKAELTDASAAAAFRIPRDRTRFEVLLELAEDVGQHALKYRHVFLRHGLARDFVKRLRSVIDAMERLAYERADWAMRGRVATANIVDGLSRAAKVVTVLDALVGSSVVGNPALRAEWEAVRRGKAAGQRLELVDSDVA